MLIKEEHFRNLYKQHVLIKDEKFAKQIAQSLKLYTIIDDYLSSDELQDKLKSIEVDDSINAILAIPYIDHTAGMSFFVLTTATLENDTATIHKRKDFSGMNITRKDSVNNMEFKYLKDVNVNDDFDLNHYEEYSEIVDSYYVNEKVEALRFIDILDGSRNEDFPDDVAVIFIKEGLQAEQMWTRYENIDENQMIDATLLNTPYQDFGVKTGDSVKIFPYQGNEGDDWILICDLNRK